MSVTTLIVILMATIVVSIVIYCLTPPDKSVTNLDIYEDELIWKKLIIDGEFKGYLELYPETIYILEDLIEDKYPGYELADLTEEDYK